MKSSTDSKKQIGFFEKYLTLWVFMCMAVGIGVGKFAPVELHALGNLTFAQVNFPVGVLIWVMVIPMLMRINFKELHGVKQYWRGMSITLVINWLVKPFSMALLGMIFIKHFFVGWLPADQIDQYIAGLIILAAAPCTAMVFVWSYLCDGEPHFTLSQVTLNDLLMIVIFAPIVGLLLGMAHITIPWATLLISVCMYILIPFIIAQLIRAMTLKQKGEAGLSALLKGLHPFSLIALLAMLVLLFGFQGGQITSHPLIVLLLAIPIIIQVYFNSMLAYWLNKKTGEAFCVAGPSALIGASNFFELAVATSISLFGFQSGATLATVVGVLVEVPVMLSVVKIVNGPKGWYER